MAEKQRNYLCNFASKSLLTFQHQTSVPII